MYIINSDPSQTAFTQDNDAQFMGAVIELGRRLGEFGKKGT